MDRFVETRCEFIESTCTELGCRELARPLREGFYVLCEAAFQHPTFDDPEQHKAYWRNVFFRLKTIRNVVNDLHDKLLNDLFDSNVSFYKLNVTEKKDKTGCVMKFLLGSKIPVEIEFTMPSPDNFNILVRGKVGKTPFETSIPETDLSSTEWSFDGSTLKDRFTYDGPAYAAIREAIMGAGRPLHEGLDTYNRARQEVEQLEADIAERDANPEDPKTFMENLKKYYNDRFNECLVDTRNRLELYKGATERVSDEHIRNMTDIEELRTLCDCFKSYVLKMYDVFEDSMDAFNRKV